MMGKEVEKVRRERGGEMDPLSKLRRPRADPEIRDLRDLARLVPRQG